MKKLLLTCAAILLSTSVSVYANKNCPCPGPCCPKQVRLISMADYLAPWVNHSKQNILIEKELAHHKV